MRYVEARYRESQRELAYRIYVCDSLRAQARGEFLQGRFTDLLDIVDGKKKIDHRSGDEIAADVIKRAGLVVEDE